ncbi:MAG: hypothetical protein H7224_04050, partial [Polaromonas sp.]|nr:hypothetical protein [Polaromonas sp.]
QPASTRPAQAQTRLVVAGAGGALGAEVLHRLAASGLFAHTDVLVTAPMVMTLPRVATAQVGLTNRGDLDAWPVAAQRADVAVVMFEPPRLTNDRERVFFTPVPAQLPALARWLQRSGVLTLVVVMPHAPGRLPDALKRGLANLDEQAVAALGFERVLLVRSAAVPVQPSATSLPEKLARWMLSISNYMIPANEQPVRPARVAEFIEAALQVLPPGTHVAAPELLHRASPASRSSGTSATSAITMAQVVHDWLASVPAPAD